MNKTIHHSRFFPCSPDLVWEFLSQSEYSSKWLMPNNMVALLGNDFEFKAGPVPSLGFDGNIYCKILEITPPERLVYSWKCGPEKGKINLESIVSWTLVPKENGTELLLNHTGQLTEYNSALYAEMEKGWPNHVKKIYDLFIAKTNAAK